MTRLRRSTLMLVATLTCLPLAVEAVDYGGCLEITLPAGEDQVIERIPLAANAASHIFSGEWESERSRCLRLAARAGEGDSGVVQASIVPAHSGMERYPGLIEMWVDEIPIERMYREILPYEGRVDRNVRIDFDYEDVSGDEGYAVIEAITSSELVVVLQRLDNRCLMTATVRGHVNGNFHGDVAYFNAFDEGVKEGFAVGTIADPTSQEMLGDFVGGINEALLQLDEMGFDTGLDEEQLEELREEEQRPEGEPTAGQKELEAFFEKELSPDEGSSGDNFGLSLTDLKGGSGPKATLANAQAMLGDAFTLTVSGNIEIPTADGGQYGNYLDVTPGTVTATLPLATESGSIRFEMPEGGGLEIRGALLGENLIRGWLRGTLKTKGPYTVPGVATDEILEVEVAVDFLAQRGAWSCLR